MRQLLQSVVFLKKCLVGSVRSLAACGRQFLHIIGVVWTFFVGKVRQLRASRKRVRRFCVAVSFLFLLSGFVRSRFGLDPPWEKLIHYVDNAWLECLDKVVKAAWVTTLLSPLPHVLFAWLAGWLIAVLVQRVDCFGECLTSLEISLRQGWKVSSRSKLTMLLAFPVMLWLVFSWTGIECFYAWLYCVMVLLYLEVCIDKELMHSSVRRFTDVQSAMGGPLVKPVRGDLVPEMAVAATNTD
jgi:hypothetical protein